MTPEPEVLVADQLLKLYRRMRAMIAEIAAEHGVTTTQLMALRLVRDHRQMSMSDLTTRMGVSKGATTGLIDRLEAAGWLQREESPDDRRVAHLSLTASGEELIAGLLASWRQRVARWYGGIEAPGRVVLHGAFDLLLSEADQ